MFLNPIYCFIIIMSGVQSSPVSLIIQDDIIVFGSTLNLLCTLADSLDLTNRRSRQWFGGSQNKILSLDGFSSDPNKYEEHVISKRQFRLKIFNINATDVNCYYKCVYGFKFDEKMLDLNTVKYQYIPAAHEIDNETNYNQEDRHISANLTFQNIYPLPECMLSVGGSKLNMSVSRKAQHGLFYQLSMSIDYTWEDNSCGTEIKIECCIGHKILPIWKAKQEQCLEMTTANTRGVNKAMVICVSLSVLFCSVVFFTLGLLWWRKCRAGNGLNTEKEDDDASTSSSSLINTAVPQYWTENATKCLLEEYREKSALIGKGTGTKKKMFQEISTLLNKQGFNFTWEQVQGQIKTLITNFKKTKDHNNKSGNERKTCPFLKELEELSDCNPTFCGPINTRETSIFQQRKRKLTDKTEDNDEEEDEEEKEETKKVDVPTAKQSKTSASIETLDLLKECVKWQKDEKQNEKEERRKMHEEIIGLLREMVKN